MPTKAQLARTSPRMALYARLHLIGAHHVPDTARETFGATSALLRAIHRTLPSELEAEDDLLEIADRLDVLVAPVVVERGE